MDINFRGRYYMYIDFGAGESILARHEEYTLSALDAHELRRTAREGQQQASWLSRYADRLRCEMDYQRLVLAERLARFDMAQSILHSGETSFFSTGQCR